MEDFARDAKVRANFLGLVESGDLGGEDMADAFAEMALDPANPSGVLADTSQRS